VISPETDRAMARFFISPEAWNLDALVLDADESHHCLHVLRCKPGDRVTVFNGAGAEASAEVDTLSPAGVTLRTISSQKPPGAQVPIALAQAIPKGKNMELIVQKATELGVSAIFPLVSERTIVRLHPDDGRRKRLKWQRVAVEACKQSGQNWLPAVAAPAGVEDFLRQPVLREFEARFVASLEPEARSLKAFLADSPAPPRSALVFIGPEGDFTPAEMNSIRGADIQPLGLGPIVLRTETAALHALSILAYELRG